MRADRFHLDRQSMKFFVVGLALLTSACASAPPQPLLGPDPSDLGSSTPPARYRSTIAPYQSRRPVEPAPWREQNERVAPEPRS
jgi:hypothetical protein